MECTSLDADVDHLLVLDPRFNLSYVKDRAKVLEDMEKQMLPVNKSPLNQRMIVLVLISLQLRIEQDTQSVSWS